MNQLPYILYLGNDADFIKSLASFIKRKPGIDLHITDYQELGILSLIPDRVPFITFVDFSCLEQTDNILNEIIFYKRMAPHNTSLFVGIFANSSSLTELSSIFSSGFQSSFIKGCEADILFSDVFQLATLESQGHIDFAEAKNIDKPIKVGVCSTASLITEDYFLIETDIELNSNQLSCSIPFIFESEPLQQLKVVEQIPSSLIYPMTSTYKVQFPYATPWEEVSTKNIELETVRTWLSFNNDNLAKSHGFLKILSQNSSLALEIYKSKTELPFHIDFSSELSKNWEQELKYRKPALIFFDLGGPDDDVIQVIDTVIRASKGVEDYAPVIVISNTPSTGESFQKLFTYAFIFVSQKSLALQTLKALSSSFVKKKLGTEGAGSFVTLATHFNSRSVDIFFEPIINTLNEHTLSLSSKIEIPFYTVLHFDLPVEFYATVIPEKGPLKKRGEIYCYRAFIHGIDEKQLTKLRQFVNQLIYSPIESFSTECVQKVMEIKVPTQVKQAPPIVIEQNQNEILNSPTSDILSARNQIKGKSKL